MRPRVALLIETSKNYGRGILRGVTSYVRIHEPWSVVVDERDLDSPFPPSLSRTPVDGILVRSVDPELVRAARRTGAVVVNLGEAAIPGVPVIYSDNAAIARLAAEHLLNCGLRHFGYVGWAGRGWSDLRRDEFARRLGEAGHPCRSLKLSGASEGMLGGPCPTPELGRWLADLPKPAGVMACYDVMGLRVLDACRREGLGVPEEVAVVGADDDAIFCELASPPLSSVAHDLEGVGYRAAQLLDRLMAGDAPPAGPVLVKPRRVTVRQSTDVLAIDDREVARALRLIRERAADGITVQELLRHVPLSRGELGKRFRAVLGRSPKAEILRVRIERVKRWLAETDYKLPRIAQLAGFSHAEYLSAVFKERTGQTPGEYRRQARVAGGIGEERKADAGPGGQAPAASA